MYYLNVEKGSAAGEIIVLLQTWRDELQAETEFSFKEEELNLVLCSCY